MRASCTTTCVQGAVHHPCQLVFRLLSPSVREPICCCAFLRSRSHCGLHKIHQHLRSSATHYTRYDVVLPLTAFMSKYGAFPHAHPHPAQICRCLTRLVPSARANDADRRAIGVLHLPRANGGHKVRGLLTPRCALIHILHDRLFVAHVSAATPHCQRLRHNLEFNLVSRFPQSTK